MRSALRLAFIGYGRLGCCLVSACRAAGYVIEDIYRRSEGVLTINGHPDVVFFCVPDDVLRGGLAVRLPEGVLCVHCSGAVDMDVLRRFSQNIGVFYPLQTFTGQNLALGDLPVYLEASTRAGAVVLDGLAKSLDMRVRVCSSACRMHLHLAAVLAANFSNHFWYLAQKPLQKAGVDFNDLRPLLQQNLDNAFALGPKASQTGPARRGDTKTMEAHLNLLKDEPLLHNLYKHISQSIQNT